jgi:hypothetical protein
MPPAPLALTFHPVTPERLPGLARFLESQGKFRYCACMRWRMPSAQFSRSTKEDRADALERLAHEGTPIGVLAYLDQEPVGWCSVAPRESYAGLERYRALPRIDDRPVWSVVCFFISAHTSQRGDARPPESRGRLCGLARRRNHRRLSGRARCAPLHLYGLACDLPGRGLPGRDPPRPIAGGDAVSRRVELTDRQRATQPCQDLCRPLAIRANSIRHARACSGHPRLAATVVL